MHAAILVWFIHLSIHPFIHALFVKLFYPKGHHEFSVSPSYLIILPYVNNSNVCKPAIKQEGFGGKALQRNLSVTVISLLLSVT